MNLVDSAETARYVPLEIGDTWEYVVPRAEGSSQSEDPEASRVFTVIGETVIESVGYLKAVSTTYSVDLEKEFERRLLLRRDSLGQVLSRSDELPWKLSPLAQNPASQQYSVREEITTERDTTIEIGGVQYAAESVRRTLFVGSYSDHDSVYMLPVSVCFAHHGAG